MRWSHAGVMPSGEAEAMPAPSVPQARVRRRGPCAHSYGGPVRQHRDLEPSSLNMNVPPAAGSGFRHSGWSWWRQVHFCSSFPSVCPEAQTRGRLWGPPGCS